MNLKEKILTYSLSAGMLLSGNIGCVIHSFPIRKNQPLTLTQKYNQDNRGGLLITDMTDPNPPIINFTPVDKYALLIADPADYLNKTRTKIENYHESLFLLQVYDKLTKNGFQDKNIFVLNGIAGKVPSYEIKEPFLLKIFEESQKKQLANGFAADWKLEDILKAEKKLREKHFNKQYDNTVSEKNIEDILGKLKKKVDTNDKFVFYLVAHGSKDGSISLRNNTESIKPNEFQKYVKGWKSNSNWFILANCYGGKTLDLTKLDNVCLFAATQTNTLAVSDSYWNGGVKFIQNKLDAKNDLNKDGIIDYNEAFAATKRQAKNYWEKHLRNYILRELGIPALDLIKRLSLQPKIKVGKNFKKVNLK